MSENKECSVCNGTGVAIHPRIRRCPICRGTGTIQIRPKVAPDNKGEKNDSQITRQGRR